MFSVSDRFDRPSFFVFEKLESLLIKALKGEEPSTEIDFVRKTYRADINIDDLVVKHKIFRTLFGNKKSEHFYDLTKEMKSMNEAEKKLIVNVCKICRILAANPTSSSTAERTFSMARRMKNWMRLSMLPSRFSSVAMLYYHKERTYHLDLKKIGNHFAQSNENHLRLFGKFTENDFSVLVLFINNRAIVFSGKRCIFCLYFNLFINMIVKFGVRFSQSRGVHFQNFLTLGPNHGGASLGNNYSALPF